MANKIIVDSTTWSAHDLPTGLTIDQNTGAISGTATDAVDVFTNQDAVQSYTPTFTVTTPYGSASKSVSLKVRKTYPILDKAGQLIERVTLDELQARIGDGTAKTRYGIGARLVVPLYGMSVPEQEFLFVHFYDDYTLPGQDTNVNPPYKGLILESKSANWIFYQFSNSKNNLYSSSVIKFWLNSASGFNSLVPYDLTKRILSTYVAPTAVAGTDTIENVQGGWFLLSASERGFYSTSHQLGLPRYNEGIFFDYYKEASGVYTPVDIDDITFTMTTELRQAIVADFSGLVSRYNRLGIGNVLKNISTATEVPAVGTVVGLTDVFIGTADRAFFGLFKANYSDTDKLWFPFNTAPRYADAEKLITYQSNRPSGMVVNERDGSNFWLRSPDFSTIATVWVLSQYTDLTYFFPVSATTGLGVSPACFLLGA